MSNDDTEQKTKAPWWARHGEFLLLLGAQLVTVGIIYGSLSQWQANTERRLGTFNERIEKEANRVTELEKKTNATDVLIAASFATISEKLQAIKDRVERWDEKGHR